MIVTGKTEMLMKYHDESMRKVNNKTLLLGHETVLEDLLNKKAKVEAKVDGVILTDTSLKNENQRRYNKQLLLNEEMEYQHLIIKIKDILFAIATTKIEISKNTYLMKYYELSINDE